MPVAAQPHTPSRRRPARLEPSAVALWAHAGPPCAERRRQPVAASGIARQRPTEAVAEAIVGADRRQGPVRAAVAEGKVGEFRQLEAAGGVGTADNAPCRLVAE